MGQVHAVGSGFQRVTFRQAHGKIGDRVLLRCVHNVFAEAGNKGPIVFNSSDPVRDSTRSVHGGSNHAPGPRQRAQNGNSRDERIVEMRKHARDGKCRDISNATIPPKETPPM